MRIIDRDCLTIASTRTANYAALRWQPVMQIVVEDASRLDNAADEENPLVLGAKRLTTSGSNRRPSGAPHPQRYIKNMINHHSKFLEGLNGTYM